MLNLLKDVFASLPSHKVRFSVLIYLYQCLS